MAGKAAHTASVRICATLFCLFRPVLAGLPPPVCARRRVKSITAVICKCVVSAKPDQSPRFFADLLFFQWEQLEGWRNKGIAPYGPHIPNATDTLFWFFKLR